MATFLIVAIAGTLLVAIFMVWPLVAGGGRTAGRDQLDAELYRDQLTELDRDLARGTIEAAEAEGARAEIARRLIASTRKAQAAGELNPAPVAASRLTAVVALIAAPALAGIIYLQVGSPGLPDCPRETCNRAAASGLPSQEEAEKQMAGRISSAEELDPDYAALLERLEGIVETRPEDVEGHRLLARGLARAGRWVEARKTNDRLIELLGPRASADDLASQAEAMIFAAGGYVSPEALMALEQVMQREPGHIMGRYYAGFALRQGGRVEEAIALWQALRAEDQTAATPRGAGWQDALTALIEETGGSGAPGPTEEDVRAADDMTPEERAAMVAGMVARLEERLTERGGEPEDWVRLINAYVQLQKTEDARRILVMSQEKIGEKTARAFVREQALLMGIEMP